MRDRSRQVMRSIPLVASPHARLRTAGGLLAPVVLAVAVLLAATDPALVARVDTAVAGTLGRPGAANPVLGFLLRLVSVLSLPEIAWLVALVGAVGLGRGRLLRARHRPSYVAWAFEWGSARAPLWGPPLGVAVTVAAAELARLGLLAALPASAVGDPAAGGTFLEHHTMTVAVVAGSLLAAHGIRRRAAWAGVWLLGAVVAWARADDAGAGVFALVGGAALGVTAVVAGRASGLLTDGPVWNPVLRRHRRRHPPVRRRAAVVMNPTKFADPADFRRRVRSALSGESGLGPAEVYDVTFLQTEPDDPGRSMTRRAIADGADLVVAAGGDGTVRTVCATAAGTGTRVGIVPKGTSNLLARNLRIPLQEGPALDVVAGGVDRAIDLARLSGPGVREGDGFVVMAGLGLDGAIMADVPDRLKKVLGLPAYVVTGARHLRDAPFEVEVTVDDAEPVTRLARMVVLGNVGSVQVFQLLPDARPDDGVLDVVIVKPETTRSLVRVLVSLARRARHDPDIEHLAGRTVRLRADVSVPRQLDGDVTAGGPEVTATVEPGAVRVRVPNRR